MERRTFLRGLAGLIAAPAIIRTPGLIMPVKAMPVIQRMEILPLTYYVGEGTLSDLRAAIDQFNRDRAYYLAAGWEEVTGTINVLGSTHRAIASSTGTAGNAQGVPQL